MSSKNLVVMVIDTNPVLWSLLTRNHNFSLTDYLNACVGFLNAYLAMSQQNACVLIAAHYKKAEYLYPSRSRLLNKSQSPWHKCEQINDIDEQIKANLKLLSTNEINEEIQQDLVAVTTKRLTSSSSTLTSALGLALCYINHIEKKFKLNDEINYRILLVKLYEDSANQYMNLMNMIFSAEKMNVPIDTCILLKDSSLLQQASNLTNGIYFKVPQVDGLLYYLLWLYLQNENLRKIFVQPQKNQVDYRAACFCHRQLIDIGFVCSVCLSVFCSFTPICSTCDSTFEFDIKILKLGKKFDLNTKSASIQQSQQTQDLLAQHNDDAQMPTQQQQQQRQSNSAIRVVRARQGETSNDYNMSNENSSSNFANDPFEMLE